MLYSPRLIGRDIILSGNMYSQGTDINHHPPRPVKWLNNQTKVWISAGGESATGNGTKIQKMKDIDQFMSATWHACKTLVTEQGLCMS